MRSHDTLAKTIEKCLVTRHDYIEMLCAAFIKEAGPLEASKCELVEERSVDGFKTMWYFRRRHEQS
jgi:hypothetical protein